MLGHQYVPASAPLARQAMLTHTLQVPQHSRSHFCCWLEILPLLSVVSLCLPSSTP